MFLIAANFHLNPCRTALAVESQPIIVGFDRTSYSVAPGQTFAVNVVIAPPSSGLFSYGVRLTFPSISASAAPSDAITVPAPLDFNGILGAGALKQLDAQTLAVKGTVRPDPLVSAYKDALIATFSLQAKSTTIGESFSLGLDLFRTIGTTETVFVDGEGNDLDGRIRFGTAMITIVPEPSILSLAFLPVLFGTAVKLLRKPAWQHS